MVLGYTQNSNQKLSLYVDRANVVGVIQKAKNLAMEKYKSTSADGNGTCAFGVHFENNSSTYFIYSIHDKCNLITVNDTYVYHSYNTEGYIEQKFALNQANIFASSSDSDIYFVPPYFTTVSTGTIVITNKNNPASSNSVKIVVNGLDISAN